MEKGNLQKTAEGLEYIRRILMNGIWVAVIVIVLAALGWYLVGVKSGNETRERGMSPVETVKPAAPVVNWNEVDQALASVLQKARQEAWQYARKELNAWTATMMVRVDESFLDWYFSYWTQQMLGLQGLYQYGVHYVINEQPTASEKLTEEIQEEFTSRVLQPQIAQRVIERIIHETAAVYLQVLTQGMTEIPTSYSLTRAEWEDYLQDIALTTKEVDGGRQTPFTLKTLTVTSGGGALLLAANMKTMLAKASSKVLSKSSGKVASSMAAKTGGKVVAKAGGKFFGTIAGFGVLIWDIWDHNATERENRPFLRLALKDYFAELRTILLDDPEYGIMSTFIRLEQEVVSQRFEGDS